MWWNRDAKSDGSIFGQLLSWVEGEHLRDNRPLRHMSVCMDTEEKQMRDRLKRCTYFAEQSQPTQAPGSLNITIQGARNPACHRGYIHCKGKVGDAYEDIENPAAFALPQIWSMGDGIRHRL